MTQRRKAQYTYTTKNIKNVTKVKWWEEVTSPAKAKMGSCRSKSITVPANLNHMQNTYIVNHSGNTVTDSFLK